MRFISCTPGLQVCNLPSVLATSSPKEITKHTVKINKTKHRNYLIVETEVVTVHSTVWCTSVSIFSANILCNESLVWVKVSGFYHIISIGSSLWLLPAVLVSLHHVNPVALVQQDWPFHMVPQFTHDIDFAFPRTISSVRPGCSHDLRPAQLNTVGIKGSRGESIMSAHMPPHSRWVVSQLSLPLALEIMTVKTPPEGPAVHWDAKNSINSEQFFYLGNCA